MSDNGDRFLEKIEGIVVTVLVVVGVVVFIGKAIIGAITGG